ncbi:MAG: sigma-70 family RNA polymerase sigma factor [Candidatus Paceibacterota bacterium]
MEHITEMESEFIVAYDRYADAIFRFCIIRTRDRDVARDIMQETFAHAWEHVASGKSIDRMRPFLYRIASNLVIDRARKHRTLSLDALMEDEHFTPPSADKGNPQDAAMIAEMLRAVDQLDEKYRTPIILRYVEGMDVGDIAAVVGESENVVSVHLHRGIEKLRELLDAQLLP